MEEDRYMRAQEELWKEKLRKLRAEADVAEATDLHKQVVEPVKSHISSMLEASGDSVSDEALESLAKWKLNL